MQAPPVDGLPLWLQVVVLIMFGVAALIAAAAGYRKAQPEKQEQATLLGASIADMGAIRHLSDVCIQLSGNIQGLERALENETHFRRETNELLRESCGRLRDIRDRLDKRGYRP